MGTAQQLLFLIFMVVLHAVVVISEVLRLRTKSRCCMAHLYLGPKEMEGDPCSKGLEPLGELGKRIEKDGIEKGMTTQI